MTVIPSAALFITAKFIPAKMSENEAVSAQDALLAPEEGKILIATILAPGATPPGPAMTPATSVPCPSQSIGSLSLSPMSMPPITLVLGKVPPPRLAIV